jgi:hypothetical protein
MEWWIAFDHSGREYILLQVVLIDVRSILGYVWISR